MGGRGQRLPNYRNAIIKRNKLKNYLLNPSKSPKAAFFHRIGYNMKNFRRFEKDIRKGLKDNPAEVVIKNRYGHEVKAYSVKMSLGINKKAVVVTGWEMENKKPRLITAYPDKR